MDGYLPGLIELAATEIVPALIESTTWNRSGQCVSINSQSTASLKRASMCRY
jgi:hypothetical protein